MGNSYSKDQKTIPEVRNGLLRKTHVGRLSEGKELFEHLKALRKHMVGGNRIKGVLPLDRGSLNPDYVSKMLECILKGTNIKIDIYCSERSGRGRGEARVFQNNAILVRTTKENYAGTLRRVKEEIGKSGKHMEFKRIRSARDGNMIIKLKEGDRGEEVRDVIMKMGEDMEAKILDKDKDRGRKYIMSDLDALITEKEITGNLKKSTIEEEEKEGIKLVSLRKAFGETQVAIVQLQKTHAERIIKEGGIRMGQLGSG